MTTPALFSVQQYRSVVLQTFYCSGAWYNLKFAELDIYSCTPENVLSLFSRELVCNCVSRVSGYAHAFYKYEFFILRVFVVRACYYMIYEVSRAVPATKRTTRGARQDNFAFTYHMIQLLYVSYVMYISYMA